MGSTFSVGWWVGCFFFGDVRPQSSFQIFQSFYGSGDCRGGVGGGDRGGFGVGVGEGGGKGGQKWLFFTLHSDQSFLNTPELRGSRIGTHPAGRETQNRSQNSSRLKAVVSFYLIKILGAVVEVRANKCRICYDTVSCGSLKTADYIFNISSDILSLFHI